MSIVSREWKFSDVLIRQNRGKTYILLYYYIIILLRILNGCADKPKDTGTGDEGMQKGSQDIKSIQCRHLKPYDVPPDPTQLPFQSFGMSADSLKIPW